MFGAPRSRRSAVQSRRVRDPEDARDPEVKLPRRPEPLASIAWASAVGNQAVQRVARATLARKWAFGYTATGEQVVKWVSTRKNEQQEPVPNGWRQAGGGDAVTQWYMEEPRRDDSGTQSLYAHGQNLGAPGEDAQRMAVVLVVDNATTVGGHTYIAFEWFDRVGPEQNRRLVRRHKVLHLEGKEARSSLWEKAKRTVGYGSAPGQMSAILPKAPEGETLTVSELDSDPLYFRTRALRSQYQAWVVDFVSGQSALNYGLSKLGNPVPFSLAPMWPSTYNCAQLAAEIAGRAGVPAFSYLGQVLPSWALYLSGGQPIGGERPRPTLESVVIE
jgi:hypothetical protein